MRGCHLTDEQLAQWEAQVGQDHWVARCVGWLEHYPQDGWKLMVGAGRALAHLPAQEFDRNILLFFARAEFRNMPDDERRGLQRASKRFLVDMRARCQDAGDWADHVCLDLFKDTPEAQDLRGALGVFNRLLPEGPERYALFQCLVLKSLEWMAHQCRSQEDIPAHWAYYDDLMALGRTCKQNMAQRKWLDEWVMMCQKYDIHDRNVARQLLEPLVDLGLDLNADYAPWVSILAARTARATQDHTMCSDALVNSLLDLGADWKVLVREHTSERMWNLIQHHPKVCASHTPVKSQAKPTPREIHTETSAESVRL